MKINQLLLHFLLCLIYFSSSLTTAQNKKQLEPKDYSLWSSLEQCTVSKNGKWVSYVLAHKTVDTLVLKSIDTNYKKCYAKASTSKFSTDSRWFAFVEKDSLKLVNLELKKTQLLSKNVLDFAFTKSSEYLVISTLISGKKEVTILNLKNMSFSSIGNVEEYKLNADGRYLCVSTYEQGLAQVKMVYLNTSLKEKNIATDSLPLFSGLQWDEKGSKVAFYKKIVDPSLSYENHKVYSCMIETSALKVTVLNPLVDDFFPKGYYIPKRTLYVSDKQLQVFFDLKFIPINIEDQSRKAAVTVWLSESPVVPPVDKDKARQLATRLTVWWTDKQKVVVVEDSQNPQAVLTGNHLNALVFNSQDVFPEPTIVGDYTNYYIKNLATGVKELVLPFHSRIWNMVMVSPGGKFLGYFKDKHWWVYDIRKKTSLCLTKGLSASFHNEKFDEPGLQPPFGSCSWTPGDKDLLVYDTHDIWKLSTDGTKKVRLTNGKPQEVVYRINEKPNKASVLPNTLQYVSKLYDLKSDLILKTYKPETYGEGFTVLTKEGRLEFLTEKESKLSLVTAFETTDNYYMMESNYETSPQLLEIAPSKKERILVQSNMHQRNFFWGRSQLLSFETRNGKKLKGALYYPAAYDATKSYPMVVMIYDKFSKELNVYVPPSESSHIGFNPTNYITNGYFVFYPDINYDLDSTGDSAVECVEAGVSKAIQTASINAKAIALLGHSFGGYEVSYVIGKSKLFKTAIIGAPVIDIVSTYLSLDGHGKSNIWRFEDGQFRLTKPFYSDSFASNSPLAALKDITAPILVWTGDKDKQVEWKNSMKFHIGLWKLRKKSVFLIYKDEEHILINETNRLDLSEKVRNWIDYYLKNKPPANWMMD